MDLDEILKVSCAIRITAYVMMNIYRNEERKLRIIGWHCLGIVGEEMLLSHHIYI